MPKTIGTVDGVLLVDKPSGMTSHDVVAIARRALGERRIGHTGTLDPFATGLLVLLVGQATRLARFVKDEPKVYEATIVFGAETNTDDATGEVLRVAELPDSRDVDAGIRALTGRISQVPPAYSAKKVAGRRAYAAARAGAPLELAPVPVTVNEWQVRSRSAGMLEVSIKCGAGTYIRALARDLGRLAHSAAHLSSLRRIRSGIFDVHCAHSLDDLRAKAPPPASMASAIPNIPRQLLSDGEAARVRQGQAVAARAGAELVALVGSTGELVAIAERDGEVFRPCIVMRNEL